VVGKELNTYSYTKSRTIKKKAKFDLGLYNCFPFWSFDPIFFSLLIVLTDKSAVINSMLLSVTDISAVNKHMRNRNDGFFHSNG
jgi:uncharacterized membrane protein